ncbi:MAG: hypothetical protein C5B55_08140 [Blastocatellia bacterium]|nr:MAG: hypothetical protein C5B55_08140 [Blastocatellia bacterium]
MYKALAVLFAVLVCGSISHGQDSGRQLRISVLDFGDSPTGRLSAERLRANLKADHRFAISDTQLAMSAAKGSGYAGSLNLLVTEARDLGAALDSDFYFIGDAQTLRRSPSQSPIYFESYCTVFIISSRTGQLLMWDRPSFQNTDKDAAEQALFSVLSGENFRQKLVLAIFKGNEEERARRAVVVDVNQPLIEAPDNEKSATEQGLSLPRPFRRLRPEYPETAARADAEAIVDVIVDVRADGEVEQVQIARWGGFGLDESTVATVKKMHFFPAQQNGAAIAMRVLLRYNFRKPQL